MIVPEEAARWPLFRLMGLVLLYVLGVAHFVLTVGLPSEAVSYSLLELLFMPSLSRVLLALGIGWQLYMLIAPWHARPRTMVLYRDQNTLRELFFIGCGLVFVFVPLQGIPFVGMFLGLIPLYLVLVASRENTTIDGVARRIVHVGGIPKLLSFDDVAGLGRIEVRVMRGGQQVGVHYYVGLFPQSGDPIQICKVPSLEVLASTLERISMTTGLPVAPRG